MADPGAFVPYNDPHASPLADELLKFDNDPNPTLADFANKRPFSYSSSLPQQYNQTNFHANDPYLDTVFQDHVQNFSDEAGNFEAGPSEFHAESHPGEQNFGSQNFSAGLPLSFWPEPPIPFFCSCCQVLREIVHTNGINFMKLEIHGRLGMICHAIQHLNIVGSSTSGNHNYQMFDFCDRTIEEIKLFLVQYCLDQNAAGYFIVQDPLSAYYEALCIGLDWTEDLNDDLVDPNPNNSGGGTDMELEAEAEDTNIPRTSIAAQRERAGKMKLTDFSDYFHLPIGEAAKQVNLCPTVMKRICRKEGLARWPHRKVKSIAKQLAILRRTLNAEDAASRERTQAEIDRLENEMIQYCGGVAPTALSLNETPANLTWESR